MAKKIRLDALLVSRGLMETLEQAQAYVMAGEVWSQQNRLEKPGMLVPFDAPLEIRSISQRYVSRAGFKLEHGLDTFGISVAGRTCMDVGCSTGGFTDCLLQRGATHVFAVDVGYGLLHQRLRSLPTVTLLERTHAADVSIALLTAACNENSAEALSFGCVDVSFISLKRVLSHLVPALPKLREWVLLFKPQFEVPPDQVSRGGIVKSVEAAQQALTQFLSYAETLGLFPAHPPTESPLPGKKSGNVEWLIHLKG